MALRIVLVIVVLIAGVLVFAATKPDTFRIERSVTINASPEKVFALIDDFHSWSKWAPQDRDDPTMQRSYSGAAAGEGAVCDWTSKGSAGAGEMRITEGAASSRVLVSAEWKRPFQVRNLNDFSLTPAGEGTRVTWRLMGTNLYVMRLMEVFVGVSGLIGRHLDSGLRNLKQEAEK